MQLTKALRPGDTIGFASPSALVTREKFAPRLEAARGLGFRVKEADTLYAASWGYAATPEERAAGINQLILDDEVRLIFFSGGEGSEDVLPLIDWAAAKAHPKRWASYSDGTSILNTVRQQADVITYYGQMPGLLPKMSDYNLAQFQAFLMSDALPAAHVPNSPWHTLTGGVAEGELIGGYLENFIFIQGNGWLKPTPGKKYVLFIEDHEKFFAIEHESALIGRLEQSAIMPQVTGLLFGHYSAPVNEQLLQRLRILGEKHGIPVCYCDDFGHGENHAILPIGAQARLDADAQKLFYV